MGRKLYEQTQGGIKFISHRMGEVRVPNFVYDIWLPILGARGVAVYSVYCRLERENVVKAITQKDIAKACRIGPGTLATVNKQLQECGFIKVTSPQGHKRLMHWTVEIEVYNPPVEVPAAIVEKYAHPQGYEALSTWLVAPEIPDSISADTNEYHDEIPDSTSKIASLVLHPLDHVATATPAPEIEIVPACAGCLSEQREIVEGGMCADCLAEIAAIGEGDAIDEPPLTIFEPVGERAEPPPPTYFCEDCDKPIATTPDMPFVHEVCTCKQEATLSEHFGDPPERPECEPSPGWKQAAQEPWATWGAQSDEFQRGLRQYREAGRSVQLLGYEWEKLTQLAPDWTNKNEVKSWSSGLWACLKATGGDASIVLSATRKAIQDGLTISKPYSVVEVSRALCAERKRGKPKPKVTPMLDQRGLDKPNPLARR